jgi:hypothetical protein
MILTGERTGLGNMFGGPALLFDDGCACIISCAGFVLLFALFFGAICDVGLPPPGIGAVCVLFGADVFAAPSDGVLELLFNAEDVFLSSLVSIFIFNRCTSYY